MTPKHLKGVILSLIFCSFVPSVLFAQKPAVKLEIPFALEADSDIYPALILPTLYIPLGQHADIGFSYNSINTNYRDYNGSNSSDGRVLHRFPSFYFRLNASNYRRTINPFVGYILSAVRGKHESEVAGHVIKDVHANMTAAEEETLQKELDKTALAHGLQIGVDIRASKDVSFFAKATTYSVAFENNGFPYHYSGREFLYRTPVFLSGGIVIKFTSRTSANKSSIK